MDLFLKNMPKIELHAHLNGSLNIESIKQLGQLLYGENSKTFLQSCEKYISFNNSDLDSCFQKFGFMHELTSTPKGLKLACKMVIHNFSEDNVIYLELRSTPKCNSNMTPREYIEILVQSIQEYSLLYNIVVKLLLSIDRAQPVEIADETVELAIDFNEKYPDIVKGIDLSGNPNKGKFKDFVDILNKAKLSKLNLALHCAEVLNPLESQEMILFGFQRCGHGTFLNREQLQECRKRNITIECCLTSNIKCKTVKSYEDHHFKNIFISNVPTVLCTDDSGIFDTTLTEEFKLASKYFHLNINDIRNLTLDAVKASFASKDEKDILKQRIEQYFE